MTKQITVYNLSREILRDELLLLIEMASCPNDEWDIPPSKIMKQLNRLKNRLEKVKNT